MELTVESVQAMAPDDASVKAARGLVIPAKWPLLGYNNAAFWGECKGSGSRPYQVRIDSQDLACKCSCPSRKFPCKHSLALLLLYVQHRADFTNDEQPEWVSEWLISRQQREARKEEKKEQSAAKAADPQTTAKRDAARQKKMTAGLEYLERWIHDRVRHGLAQLPTQQSLFTEVAARMVDAQLPGIAMRLKNLAGTLDIADEWPRLVCSQLGQLQLIIDAYRHQEALDAAERTDLNVALGVSIDKSDAGNGETIEDSWRVIGQSAQEENKLWRRRVWLYGETSRRTALLLDFSHGGKNFTQHFISGQTLRSTLAFYPSASPLRALLTGSCEQAGAFPLPPLTLDDALHELAHKISANPWQWPLPLRMSNMLIHPDNGGWQFSTVQGQQLPVRLPSAEGWQLLAVSGGVPFMLMGEWDGNQLTPCSAWLDDRLVWENGGEQ